MSNKRTLKSFVPDDVAACARAARCSDCPGKATARGKRGTWEVVMHHTSGCPSYRQVTKGLQLDAAASVARAADATGSALRYVADGPGGWVLPGSVTAGRPSSAI